MNENNDTVDINGSVMNSIKGIATGAVFMVVIAIIFGILFAPIFAPLFEEGVKSRNRDKYNNPNYDVVHMKMGLIRLALLIVAISAWIGVIYLYNCPPNGSI